MLLHAKGILKGVEGTISRDRSFVKFYNIRMFLTKNISKEIIGSFDYIKRL